MRASRSTRCPSATGSSSTCRAGTARACGRLLDAAYNEEYGAETTDQSALNLIYLLGVPGIAGQLLDFRRSPTSGSTSPVATNSCLQAMATYLVGPSLRPRLGDAVDRARTSDGTVSMGFTTRGKAQTVDRRSVILCMSFSVLRTLDCSGQASTS